MALVTVPEMKAFLGIETSDQDIKLELILDSMIGWIEEEFKHYGLLLGDNELTELRDGTGDPHFFTRFRPINSVTSVHVSASGPDQVFDATTLVPANEYVVKGGEGKVELVLGSLIFFGAHHRPHGHAHDVHRTSIFRFGIQNIQVIYKVGLNPIPKDIKLALMSVVDSFNTRAGKTGFKSEKLGDYSYTLREAEKISSAESSTPTGMAFELKLLLSHYLKPTFTVGI